MFVFVIVFVYCICIFCCIFIYLCICINLCICISVHLYICIQWPYVDRYLGHGLPQLHLELALSIPSLVCQQQIVLKFV